MKFAVLGEVLTDVRPGFASGDDLEDGIFQLRMSNVTREGRLVTTTRRRVGPDHKQVPKTLLMPGDVLFNATNSRENVGKTAYFDGCDEPAVYSNHFLRLRADTNRLEPKYLARWLQHEADRGYFAAKCRAWVNQATFDQKMLVDLRIPLPTLVEQRRIVAILDAADELRATRRRALEKLETLDQAIFADTFGDGRETYDLVELGPLTTTITKGTTPTSVGFEFTDAGVPFVRVQDLASGTVAWQSIDLYVAKETSAALPRSILKPRDVLISIAGTVGRCAIVPDDAPELNCNQAVALVRVGDALDPIYLHSWLGTAHAQEQMTGSRVTGTISNLSLSRIGQLRLPVPPIEEQELFASRVQVVAIERRRLARSAAAMDRLLDSLKHRAFAGEL